MTSSILNIPGVISESNDPRLTSWLEQVSRLITNPDFSEIIPGVIADNPWSAESLISTEQVLRDTYSSFEELPEQICLNYERFIGEGIKQLYDGTWVYLTKEFFSGQHEATFGVSYADNQSMTLPKNLVRFAIRRVSEHFWLDDFESTRRYLEVFKS